MENFIKTETEASSSQHTSAAMSSLIAAASSSAATGGFCRKKLDFGAGVGDSVPNHSTTLASLQNNLNEKLRKMKKTTSTNGQGGSAVSKNNVNEASSGVMMMNAGSASGPGTGVRSYHRSQYPKMPSNTKRNARERKRVRTINDYFAQLQKYLPHSKSSSSTAASSSASSSQQQQANGQLAGGSASSASKKLSKVETLKAAIEYIEYLQTFCPNLLNFSQVNQLIKANISSCISIPIAGSSASSHSVHANTASSSSSHSAAVSAFSSPSTSSLLSPSSSSTSSSSTTSSTHHHHNSSSSAKNTHPASSAGMHTPAKSSDPSPSSSSICSSPNSTSSFHSQQASPVMATANSAKNHHHLKARQQQQQQHYDAYASAHGFYASQSELVAHHHYNNHSQQYHHMIEPASLENVGGLVYNGQVAASECLNSSINTPSSSIDFNNSAYEAREVAAGFYDQHAHHHAAELQQQHKLYNAYNNNNYVPENCLKMNSSAVVKHASSSSSSIHHQYPAEAHQYPAYLTQTSGSSSVAYSPTPATAAYNAQSLVMANQENMIAHGAYETAAASMDDTPIDAAIAYDSAAYYSSKFKQEEQDLINASAAAVAAAKSGHQYAQYYSPNSASTLLASYKSNNIEYQSSSQMNC